MDFFNDQMLSGELADFWGRALEIPTGTVLDRFKSLRADGLLSKHGRGPRSGARMTDIDAVNALLANIINVDRGESVSAAVRRFRRLRPESPISQIPSNFSNGVSFLSAPNAGLALDFLLADMRSGRLDAWAEGEPYELLVSFNGRGACVIFSLDKPKRHGTDIRYAFASFATAEFARRKKLVERTVVISGEVFTKLAQALGPPS